jgi:hypothetical protein
MPRRSELGWILVMVVVAVSLGFLIGGGPSLLTGGGADASGDAVVAASSSTTTATPGVEVTTVPPATTTATATTVPGRAPKDVAVRVYNGSTKAGQAVVVGDRLKAAGYNVLAPGPSPSDPLAASVIQFAEGYAPEAAALAVLLGLPATATTPLPTPPVVAGIGPANVVLIVADDLVPA